MEKTQDTFAVVQQVQGMCEAYVDLRNKVVELQKQLDTRNEDNRRLQKLVAELQKK